MKPQVKFAQNVRNHIMTWCINEYNVLLCIMRRLVGLGNETLFEYFFVVASV